MGDGNGGSIQQKQEQRRGRVGEKVSGEGELNFGNVQSACGPSKQSWLVYGRLSSGKTAGF